MRFLCRLVVLLPICLGACTNVHQTTKKYNSLSFADFLLVTPSEWTERDIVEKFVEHKRRSGFNVTVIPINLDLSAQERFDHVRNALRRHDPTKGSAVAVLILGDLEMIPAGPWQIEGVREHIYSDVPVAITREKAPALHEEVEWQDLEGHFDQLPSHIVGRIPYGDPSLVDIVLDSSMRYEQKLGERQTSALFAAPQWGPPFAIGIIIDGANDAMVEFGWDSAVYGIDGTPDFPLRNNDYLVIGNEKNGRRETFVASGAVVTLKVLPAEPVTQLPQAGDGLSWVLNTKQGESEKTKVSVSCFALYPRWFRSASVFKQVNKETVEALKDFMLPVISRILKSVRHELGEVEVDSMELDTAGVSIVRSHDSASETCTCSVHWGSGHCSGCGASFSSIREKIQLDTQSNFCQRNFNGKPPTVNNVLQEGITNVWVEESPALVYTVGHGGRIYNGWESTLAYVVSTASIATASLVVAAEEESFVFEVGKELQPVAPANPAVLFATGCAVAAPGDPLLRELFMDRWIVAYLGATTTVGPYPILPSTNAESNIARHLGGGLPVGLAGHATLAGYLNDARLDPTLYLIPGMIEGMRTNLASYILYGDPTLKLPATPATGPENR